MLSVYCVSHKEVDLKGSGIRLLGVANATGGTIDYRDSDGASISDLNDRFSELTGHYYIWKNCVPTASDARVGFCHYRRFLMPPAATRWIENNCSQPFDNRDKGGEGNYASGYMVEQSQLRSMFESCDYLGGLDSVAKDVEIVLPRRNHLQPGGFLGQYERCHPIEPFDLMLDIIDRRDSRMASAAREFYSQFEYAYWNNLFITRFDLFSDYCEFAFDILLQVNSELDEASKGTGDLALDGHVSKTGVYQNRVCAFLSERLLNFWIYYKNLKKSEVDWCVTSEIQNSPESHQVALPI